MVFLAMSHGYLCVQSAKLSAFSPLVDEDDDDDGIFAALKIVWTPNNELSVLKDKTGLLYDLIF